MVNNGNERKTGLITGITGQDGSYLTELLLSKGYIVYGIIRCSSSFNTGRIDHLYQDPHDGSPGMRLVYGDMNDASSLNQIIRTVEPDEIYNLAAQSSISVRFRSVNIFDSKVSDPGTYPVLNMASQETPSAEILPFVSPVLPRRKQSSVPI